MLYFRYSANLFFSLFKIKQKNKKLTFGVRKLFPPILKVDIFSQIIYPDDSFFSLSFSQVLPTTTPIQI